MEIYRVRKSWINIRSQVGAFLIFENAVDVAKKSKCNVYDGSKRCVWSYCEYRQNRPKRFKALISRRKKYV